MNGRSLRRLSWAVALAVIAFFAWRDLAGIGAALTGLNAARLAGGDEASYAKFLRIGLSLASARQSDFALAIAPDTQPMESAALSAALLNNLAYSAWQQGDRQMALDRQRQAVHNEPDSAEFHFNLGLMLAETGDLAGAQAALREATLLAPDWVDAQVHLSTVALARGELDLAEKAARRALAQTPNNLAAAHALAGSVLTGAVLTGAVLTGGSMKEQGDVEMQTTEIAELAKRFPHDPTLHLYQAIQLRNAGQRQASTDLLLNLLRTNQDQAFRERLKAELALNAR